MKTMSELHIPLNMGSVQLVCSEAAPSRLRLSVTTAAAA